jgi:hypothetical protein
VQGAGFVYNALLQEYGLRTAFCSEYSIPPGADSEVLMNTALQHAQVLAVIAGRGWADSLEGSEKRRGHPWVIHEVATALERRMRILPILITNRRRIEGKIPQRIARVAGFQTMNIPVVNDRVDTRHPAIDPLDINTMLHSASMVAKYIGVVLCPNILWRSIQEAPASDRSRPPLFDLPMDLFGDYD